MDASIRWPLASNVIRHNVVSNTFGMVRRYADGRSKPHQGWDFYAATGTPCFAIAAGRVAFVSSIGDYGKTVVHSFQLNGRTLYAAYSHMSSIAVAEGDAVAKGQQIGRTGTSGNAMGMTGRDQHLHFEIREVPCTGRGLAGRISPLEVFRACPLDVPALAEP
jgi:murein DD-endopeptidase MepM/ murein hydrolase activator NlpD